MAQNDAHATDLHGPCVGLPSRASSSLSTAAAGAAQEALSVTDVDGQAIVIEDTSRVATLGGVFTETAYALGAAGPGRGRRCLELLSA